MRRLSEVVKFLWESRWPLGMAVLMGLYCYALGESYKASATYESLQVLP